LGGGRPTASGLQWWQQYPEVAAVAGRNSNTSKRGGQRRGRKRWT